MKVKRILSLLLTLGILLTLIPANVFAVQRISNQGQIDGIDADPAVGIHNSYAWCGELFEQTDGDYLWVGVNRDLGGLILSAAGAPKSFYNTLKIPEMSADRNGKIYRYKMGAYEPEWELMYENPAFSGYRKMIVFNDDLYVFAGLTNRTLSPGYHYSAVYRFGKDFKPGDTPETVLWERLPGPALEYFRAACVYQDKLYVGTFDSKIYSTDGAGLTNLTPHNSGTGDKSTGWEEADLKSEDEFEIYSGAAIWDLIGYNDSLYAFVAGTGDGGTGISGGFRVYELTEKGSGIGYDVKQIVGDQENGGNKVALYPAGLGISGHVAASPFIYDDYVYVTTFANGPGFLQQLATGNIINAMNMFAPAAIYRFNESDEWETVVGDKSGHFMPYGYDEYGVWDSASAPPNIGNQRAGFFPGFQIIPNMSSNQYIWQMAEYEDKLYASTWDINSFRDIIPKMLILVFAMNYGTEYFTDIEPSITAFYENLTAVFANFSEVFNYEGVANDVAELLPPFIETFRTEIDGGDPAIIYAAFQKLLVDLTAILISPLREGFGEISIIDATKDLAATMSQFARDVQDAIAGGTPESIPPLFDALADDIVSALNTNIGDAIDYDFLEVRSGILALLPGFISSITSAGTTKEAVRAYLELNLAILDVLNEPFTKIKDEIGLDLKLMTDLLASMLTLGIEAFPRSGEEAEALAQAMVNTALAAILYVATGSDPAGFDLFFSADGENFQPYTVNGMGDKYNYGGRVLLPTKYGLFILTANPFFGCQVWRMGDVEPEILTNMPESAAMKINESVSFNVKSVGLSATNLSVTLSNGTVAQADIQFLGELDPILDYDPTVDLRNAPVYGGNKYVETDAYNEIKVNLYKVTLTGKQEFSGDVDVTVKIDGKEITDPITLTITPSGGGGGEGGTSYTVTFVTNGGSAISNQTVTSGAKATKPSDPTKEGYTFAGWYTDAELTTEYDFTKNVTGNITLYAKWTEGGGTTGEWQNPFIDVDESDWFYNNVKFGHQNGLFTGTSSNTFSPNEPMSRAMIATVLYRYAGSPDASDLLNPFDDVASGQWYTDAIKWAFANGVVLGYSSTMYGPNDKATREQLAAILWRYAGKPAGAGDLGQFVDSGKISSYAFEALKWANGVELISGYPDKTLKPQGEATRAEVTAIIHRYIESVMK